MTIILIIIIFFLLYKLYKIKNIAEEIENSNKKLRSKLYDKK